MGTDADANRSPRDGHDSPQSRRSNSGSTTAVAGRNLTSHWANVVRGGGGGGEREVSPTSASPPVAEIPLPMSSFESDQSLMKPPSLPENAAGEAPGEGSDNAVDGSANAPWATKKPAWKKPSNGVIEVGPVMGSAWPALSESARASPKCSDFLKTPSDGSVPVSTSPGPVAASSPKKLNVNDANPNLPPNHVFPARHKPAKRGGSIGPANNGSFMPLPVESRHARGALDKPAAMVAVADSSPRDHPPKKMNNWETGPRPPFIPQPPIGANHPWNTFRRGNGGARGGGNGNYRNNYGNWRDQDRANYEWNDVHMRQQRVVPRNFTRLPPPTPAPYVTPPIRPFDSPMGFPDLLPPPYYIPVLPPESLRGAPFVAHVGPPPMFFPSPDAQLRAKLIKQIDYYFSSDNLCKDLFLRSNMDEHGWVPVSLIARFNRVKELATNIQFILDAVRMSTAVEVQGDKIRKRNDWMNWILPPAEQSAALSSPQSPALSTYDKLATGMQNVGLDEWTAPSNIMKGSINPHPEEVLTRSSSVESNNQSLLAIATGTSTGDER